MGLLRVNGTLDLNQFWPRGDSDADTTTILVSVAPGAIKFSKDGVTKFKTTHAFDSAMVRGRSGSRAAIRNNKITVRLQGIDAPELHYRPAVLDKKSEPATDTQKAAFKRVNHEYRQRFGETATIALGAFLDSGGANPLKCKVETVVEYPDEVFDTYGRMVGDVIVEHDGAPVNVNLWLVANGWAFPGLYVSLMPSEVMAYAAAYQEATKSRQRVAGNYSTKIVKFEPELVKRKKGSAPDPAADAGPVMLPKLYRRQVSWWARRQAKIFKGSFYAYLKSKEKSDVFYLTADFLKHSQMSAPVQMFTDHFKGTTEFELRPEQMVYAEATSSLVGADGKPVTSW